MVRPVAFVVAYALCLTLGAALTAPKRFAALQREAKKRSDEWVDRYRSKGLETPPPCPCSDKSLCEPVSGPPTREKEVFGFHGGGAYKRFDWKRISTIAWGETPGLLCLAHQHNVRIILSAPSVVLTDNATARADYASTVVQLVQHNFADGVTFDYESPLPIGSPEAEWYAALISETRAALHKANPSYQVSTCVAWSPDSIDGRNYPIVDLAKASDLLYVMDYDTRSQVFDACLASANAPYFGMVHGLQRYLALGVDPGKLILGVPWHGYHYTCEAGTKPTDRYCPIPSVPFRGYNCSDAAGTEIQIDDLPVANATVEGYDKSMNAPWFNTFDGKVVSQYWYDNAESLGLKYTYAKSLQLKGVGPFCFDDIDGLDDQKRQNIWDAFELFF